MRERARSFTEMGKQRPETMTRAERLAMIRRADELYHPCWCGVHVCGSSPLDEAMTVANIPARSPDEARQVWLACKAEAEASRDEPQDLVVDLNIDRDNMHVEDFSISRQMLDRCLEAGRRQASVR